MALIRDKGIKVDKEEVQLIRREFATGRFAVMKQFKDALIRNYSVEKPIIPVKIFNDSFNVHVNKWKQAGTELVVTEAYDSVSKKFKRSFTHEPVLVPDYQYMKLFWATCLIHNLDSQVMDNIALFIEGWLLPIHDADLSLPGSLRRIRNRYASNLKEINDNRYSILTEYRKSIGATSLKADVAFYRLFNAVVDAGNQEFNAVAMK